jgi:hypothetical protein
MALQRLIGSVTRRRRKIFELLERVVKGAGELGSLERFEWVGDSEGLVWSRKEVEGEGHDIWEIL